MKKILLTGSLLFVLSPLTFATEISQITTCESLKAEITQKIIKNGVSETDFKLEVIPDDQVVKDNAASGKIVGHCDSGKQKIVYVRLSHTNPVSANTDGEEGQK
ncbi:DUF1161 domain-containing protein [Xenorhabdus nematophila]|uniref:DUF1161 domain-containing protein n=2 Tax=Xenorhabdus nematophila TaxID=628 RepID=D3VFQ4_XENNA|nr:DUF1161 domain-containing protein [Xenorhabdus nematophila]CEE89944.1 conserved hypothetical protein; putative exported protein [Xenorhabdus nematophila str. Anatoliense]CEF29482.1 conserved hypothetical protein; putative exported protein [Xenorhabdus nematophila str. Websteri]AYA40188.1 DUF1161 domain-containing protein [Xenorhabdus nematophila]KHD27393.1 membrane protein [Xenorhabdus nematophila]MBA0018857.1 DUF1161 domain-containing protein [Xenorhabdus nematophila]